jgi:hypothetical protein
MTATIWPAPTDAGVRLDLDRKGRERRVAVGVALDDDLFVLRVVRFDRGHVQR